MPPTPYLVFRGHRVKLDQHDDALPVPLIEHREMTQSHGATLKDRIDRPSQRPRSHGTNRSLATMDLDAEEADAGSFGDHSIDTVALLQEVHLQVQRDTEVGGEDLIRLVVVCMHVLAVHNGIRLAGQLMPVAIGTSGHRLFNSITEQLHGNRANTGLALLFHDALPKAEGAVG